MNTRNRSRYHVRARAMLALLAAGCSLGTVTTALAENSELQTIMVTALKRREPLAKVPASITVFTAATLRNYNMQSFND